MKTNGDSRMGLKRMSAESRCAVAKPSIPIAIEGHDVKIFTDNIEENALELSLIHISEPTRPY